MKIGVPREIKTNENRIALVPAGAEALVGAGHSVFVEQGGGLGSGFPDDAYRVVGASILPTADEVWQQAEMIMKVKEPIAAEWPRMRRGQVIYTYFHFAAAEDLTRAVIDSGAIAVAYETVQLSSGDRCSRRCPRWRVAWQYRKAPSIWRRYSEEAGFCWAAFPVWPRGKSSSSAAEW
jgi:alanine dehydrogenase